MEHSAVATGLEKSVFITIPKKGNAKEYSNYHTIALISHVSNVMLKILQVRLQQYTNWELPDVQVGFRKGRGNNSQIANIHCIIEKAREFQKKHLILPHSVQSSYSIMLKSLWPHGLQHARLPCPSTSYFCLTDYANVFDFVDHNKLWKILKEMEIPNHLTCHLRNLYAGQVATVKTRYGTADWFQIGKGVVQGYILSLCLFNLYAEYIMWNARLDEATSWNQDCREK